MFPGPLINRSLTKAVLGRNFGLFKWAQHLRKVFKNLFFDFRTWGLMLHPKKIVLRSVSKISFFWDTLLLNNRKESREEDQKFLFGMKIILGHHDGDWPALCGVCSRDVTFNF
jgi:hypothetical protein